MLYINIFIQIKLKINFKMKGVFFQRFKKKSLSLMYSLIPDDMTLINKIRNKKLTQCILKLHSVSNLEERKTQTGNTVYFLVKLSSETN